jgi:hypothetical protein
MTEPAARQRKPSRESVQTGHGPNWIDALHLLPLSLHRLLCVYRISVDGLFVKPFSIIEDPAGEAFYHYRGPCFKRDYLYYERILAMNLCDDS